MNNTKCTRVKSKADFQFHDSSLDKCNLKTDDFHIYDVIPTHFDSLSQHLCQFWLSLIKHNCDNHRETDKLSLLSHGSLITVQ